MSITIRKLSFTNRKQFLGCTGCFSKIIFKTAKLGINFANVFLNMKSQEKLKGRKKIGKILGGKNVGLHYVFVPG